MVSYGHLGTVSPSESGIWDLTIVGYNLPSFIVGLYSEIIILPSGYD